MRANPRQLPLDLDPTPLPSGESTWQSGTGRWCCQRRIPDGPLVLATGDTREAAERAAEERVRHTLAMWGAT